MSKTKQYATNNKNTKPKPDPQTTSGSVSTSSTPEETSFNNFVEEMTQSDKLEDQIYFHGVLPRDEIIFLLQRNGDFLVRESIKGNESHFILSVFWDGPKHFIVAQHDISELSKNGQNKKRLRVFELAGECFNNIPDLVLEFFINHRTIGNNPAKISRPIRRAKWELKNEDIVCEGILGKGNFAEVWKAKLKTIDENTNEQIVIEVAVKRCIAMSEEERLKFLREARIMRQYSHQNITKLIGVCATKIPIMIVMELVAGGALNTHLRKNKTKTTIENRFSFSLDTSAGMEYLESKNCIHRDLAARNCLLTLTNIVKIADFGMSKEGIQYAVKNSKQFPVKWTAPEASRNQIFTTKSDVWSYGVLLWEIFSDAQMPYVDMTNKQATIAVEKGYRLEKPASCPDDMYSLLLMCWDSSPDQRPSFSEIRKRLGELSVANTNQTEVVVREKQKEPKTIKPTNKKLHNRASDNKRSKSPRDC